MFSHIASGTSNNQILRTIRSTTREGDYMVNVIVFAYLLVAIVASPFLRFNLPFNVIWGMSATIARNTRFTVMIMCACLLAMCHSIILVVVTMLMIIFGAILSIPLIIVCLTMFLVSRLPFLRVRPQVLSVFLIVPGMTLFHALLTLTSPSTFGLSVSREKLFCGGLDLFTLSTLLVSFWWRRGFRCVFAYFAQGGESICLTSITWEEFGSCRLFLLTSIALLQRSMRNFSHVLNHLCLVTLFLEVARVVRCPTFSHGLITPLLGNHLYYSTNWLVKPMQMTA